MRGTHARWLLRRDAVMRQGSGGWCGRRFGQPSSRSKSSGLSGYCAVTAQDRSIARAGAAAQSFPKES